MPQFLLFYFLNCKEIRLEKNFSIYTPNYGTKVLSLGESSVQFLGNLLNFVNWCTNFHEFCAPTVPSLLLPVLTFEPTQQLLTPVQLLLVLHWVGSRTSLSGGRQGYGSCGSLPGTGQAWSWHQAWLILMWLSCSRCGHHGSILPP